jgi:hypothetical protein
MIIKQFARMATLVGLSGCIFWVAIAPASFAKPIAEPTASAQANRSTLRQGIPGRRLGGGTRNELLFANAYDSLVALTAPDPLTITSAAHPQMLFYVPEMLAAHTVEFVLRDRSDALVYETTFSLAREAGIVSIDLAESGLPALALNENYQWYFSIVPNALDRANDVVVHGSIRRVDSAQWLAQQPAGAALQAQLAAAEPLEKARILYQQADLWHDAALILAALHQANPGDSAIASEWTQLLRSAGLLNLVPASPSPVQIGLI